MLTPLQIQKLTKFFSMYDTNCDGFLDQEDFKEIVKSLVNLKHLGTRSPKYLILKERFDRAWTNLKNHADSNHDKHVSLEEWLTYYDQVLLDESLYQQELHSLMEIVFEIFDDNGDGKISPDEWGNLLKIYHVSPIYAPQVFQQLDHNQDGFLDRAEIMDLIYRFFYSDDPQDLANRMFGPY